MSRTGKVLVYLLPLEILLTILLLRHPALTQNAGPAADRHSGSAAETATTDIAPDPLDDRSDEKIAADELGDIDDLVTAGEMAEAPAGSSEATAGRTVVVKMLVTAYCPCRKCCGQFADGKTASGKRITHNDSRFVAADTSILPFGTKLSIPGYYNGQIVPVEDRGGRIKGRRLDVFFLSHQRAKQWGSRWVDVTVHLDR